MGQDWYSYGSLDLSLIPKMAVTVFKHQVSRQEERGRSRTNHMAPLLSGLPFTSCVVIELSHKVTTRKDEGGWRKNKEQSRIVTTGFCGFYQNSSSLRLNPLPP